MWRLKLIAGLLALATLPRQSHAAPLADFVDYSHRTTAGVVDLPGRLFIPPEAAASTIPRPLMLFLHGGGAAGTNNITQVEHTPDYLLDEAKRRGAYLYVPQSPTNWSPNSLIDSVAAMVTRAVDELHANARRLYVTGYSNGGGGSWNLINRHPDQFAAAVVVAGVAPATGFLPSHLVDTPIFAVHARDDATVGVDRSRTVVNGVLTAAGLAPPAFPVRSAKDFFVFNSTLPFHQSFASLLDPATSMMFPYAHADLDLLYYEGLAGGHSGPLGVFYVPITYDWMFSHVRGVAEPASGCLALWAVCLIAARRARAKPRAPLHFGN